MDERKREQRTEPEADRPEPLEDLDVPDRDGEDVKGGAEPIHNYSFKQAWPKKYSG
jgi:hypothetical protein